MDFDGGPFSVGSFSRGGHIREPDRVADEFAAARNVSKPIAV